MPWGTIVANNFNITLVLVNFTASSYIAEVNATIAVVNVTAFGSFNSILILEVIPDATHIPRGGNYKYMHIMNYKFVTTMYFNRWSIFWQFY